MPLYEFECKDDASHPRQEHWLTITGRNSLTVKCACGAGLQRVPGGHGLLYFEEGRGRIRTALSDKPITSKAQHERLMRQNGVVEAGNNLPPGIAKREPKTEAMRRFRSKDQGGKWL